jgi:hypothetical protein
VRVTLAVCDRPTAVGPLATVACGFDGGAVGSARELGVRHIGRYRQETAALGYHGDTIVNSLGGILLVCGVGFVLARRLLGGSVSRWGYSW